MKTGVSTACVLVAAYLVHLLNVWVWLAGIDATAYLKFIGLLLSGLGIGALASRLECLRGLRYPLAVSAFLAALTFWLPVVVVTYGFALIGVPLLGLYSLLFVSGWHLSIRLGGPILP